jgi:hypothetical protein
MRTGTEDRLGCCDCATPSPVAAPRAFRAGRENQQAKRVLPSARCSFKKPRTCPSIGHVKWLGPIFASRPASVCSSSGMARPRSPADM